MEKRAQLSEDRKYRYTLWREWGDRSDFVVFIGLNPSTADETNDDPTIRRCIGFAKRWGYGALCMVNLFSYRATAPIDMMKSEAPIGQMTDSILIYLCEKASKVVAAWGTLGAFQNRDKEVMALIKGMWCLGRTKGGFPRHPLYVKNDTALELFNPPTVED